MSRWSVAFRNPRWRAGIGREGDWFEFHRCRCRSRARHLANSIVAAFPWLITAVRPADPAGPRPLARLAWLNDPLERYIGGYVLAYEDFVLSGLRDWRFVPNDWKSPIQSHLAIPIDPEDFPRVWAKWCDYLAACPPQTWHRPGGRTYTRPVDYDPVERPNLVCVVGIQ